MHLSESKAYMGTGGYPPGPNSLGGPVIGHISDIIL